MITGDCGKWYVKYFIIGWVLFLSGRTLEAQTTSRSLFSDTSVINIEIRADFSTLLQDRGTDPSYHEAELSYMDQQNEKLTLPARIRVRGNFRKKPENCEFPPLLINFNSESVRGTLFENQNKLKLVTPCTDENYVLEEYLIYRIYNLITDVSFRVRLVKVIYFDTSLSRSFLEKYGFFIEPEEELATRTGRAIVDKVYNPYQVDRKTMVRLGLFQYMIGNKDWYVTTRHNILLLLKEGETTPVPVPYDFDFSGLIDADYTKPKNIDPALLENRQVYHYGICWTEEEKKRSIAYFQEMRKPFEEMIKSDPDMPRAVKHKVIHYLAHFYLVLRSPSLVKQEFDEKCYPYVKYVKFTK